MKFLDEYREAVPARQLANEIRRITTRPWTLMEVCGGQTHAILKFGIDELLPQQITLIHGPGCPVCVTPIEIIDQALELARRPEVIFTSFGDMLRVPGSHSDLLSIKAGGGDVRMVYSPLDAVKIAEKNPAREIVFFAVGFETTAPATALAVEYARERRLENFSMLVSHVLVPPAMATLMSSPDCCVQAFLAAGHVCMVMGYEEYLPLATKYRIPIVVTGFEPLDILHGVLMAVRQLESGRAEVENQYRRSVCRMGNQAAQDMIKKVFTVVPRKWRGLGEIPASGLGLAGEYARFDAAKKFDLTEIEVEEPAECFAGLILRGLKRPCECPSFGAKCTPEHPVGAPMVSSEGACAAYYRYRRHETSALINAK
jgi:hydrogenase expression/formation protein HypD